MGVLGGSISCGVAARSFSGMYAALFKVTHYLFLYGMNGVLCCIAYRP